MDDRRMDDGRTDGRRTTEPAYTISSPGAFGSGELKTVGIPVFCVLNFSIFFLLKGNVLGGNQVRLRSKKM